MSKPMLKIKVTLDNLCNAISQSVFKIDNVESAVCGFKTSNVPPADGYVKTNHVKGDDVHCWFKASFDTPKPEKDYEYYLRVYTSVSGWDALNPQFILYLNGYMAQGFDTNHREARLSPDTHYDMANYCYGSSRSDFYVTHEVIKVNTRIRKLYYDMLIPYEACRDVYKENSYEYAKVISILEETTNLLDLRSTYSDEYTKSIEAAIEYINREFYEKLCSTEGKPTVNCIGHTHIDVEWLWDRFVTKEKIQRSFATAKALMDEYPHYKFMLSQPELYRYLKEEAPEKYEELKALVKEGRWEPDGAMYVECDCNLSSGESLVRQILKGTEFFRREFGTECHMLFLPDVFGYSAALPQILKKSGIDYFITSKISWNDTNTLPYDTFMWQGIDGTEIFSTFITGQGYDKNGAAARGTTYVGNNDTKFVFGTWNRQTQKQYVNDSLNTYGFGDGGGGPSRDMLERLSRMMKGLPGFPVATSKFIYPYLKKMEADFKENAQRLRKTPKWVGELYLEYHRGTYTTMANNKRGNRKMEFALEKCEALSMTDLIFGGSYDKAALDDAWRVVLHNQFHDILPGSSIEGVYKLTKKDYENLYAFSGNMIDEKLGNIAKNLNTDGGILVYNALGFPRRDGIRYNGKYYVTDTEIPALGYSVIKPADHTCTVKAKNGYLENEYYVLKLDKCGRIVSLFDKRIERQVLSAPANEVRFYEDYPSEYDAWEIDSEYATKTYVFDAEADCEIISDGDRSGLRFARKYMNTTVNQTVWLTSGSERIDIDTDVNWNEKHQMMKLAFPLDINSSNATFEIQYGHTTRPTHRNTSWDEAKFEVCAHKWVDLSENGYGIALLNESKYGHSVFGNEITITCLRSPTYPNPHADEGKHSFTVSLLPHVNTLAEGCVIEEAYSLNQPLEAIEVNKNSGNLSESFSLASSSNNSVIIECVKKAEDNDDMIVRLYEAKGGHAKTEISVCEGFTKAYLCDLMERPIKEISLNNGKVKLDMTSFEIETLRFAK